jgi:hypothetical protein
MERQIFWHAAISLSSTNVFIGGGIRTIVTVEIDLAKNVFAVHGVDATGKPVLLKPKVPRTKLAERIDS